MPPARPLLERFEAKVDRSGGPDACHPWTGALTAGYGSLRKGAPLSGATYAHRVAFELEHGPIPDGMVVDHECHNRDPRCPGGRSCRHRRCCNPRHLRAATQTTNKRDGRCGAIHADKTHCPKGHPYDEANTYIRPDGWRECRACRRQRRAAYEARRK